MAKDHKWIAKVSAIVFCIVAVLHLIRVLSGWNVLISDWEIPLWASILAVIFAGWLCYENWQLQK